MQEDVKIVISETGKTSLLREIVGPVVPVECQAMDQSHEFKVNYSNWLRKGMVGFDKVWGFVE